MMKDFLMGIRIAWALRPISDRAMLRRIRRNAADPKFWEDVRKAMDMAMRLVNTPQGKAAYPPRGWTERLMCTEHPGDPRTCQNCRVINCSRATACIWCAAELPQGGQRLTE